MALDKNKRELRVCPFCGKTHDSSAWVNTICTCGSKYYFIYKLWLNRNNGEWRTSREV